MWNLEESGKCIFKDFINSVSPLKSERSEAWSVPE